MAGDFAVRSISINGVEIPVTEQQAQEISDRTAKKFAPPDPVIQAAQRFYHGSPEGPCDGKFTLQLLRSMHNCFDGRHQDIYDACSNMLVYVPTSFNYRVLDLAGAVEAEMGAPNGEIGKVESFRVFGRREFCSREFNGRTLYPVVMMMSLGRVISGVRGVEHP